MKLILAALLLLLTACAGLPFTDEARAREIMEGVGQFYRTDAVIGSGEDEVRVRIYRPDPSQTRVEVLYPQRVAGLVYTFREEGVRLEMHGLVFNMDSYAGGSALPIPQAVGALAALLLPTAERGLPTEQDGLWVLRGQFGGQEYMLFLDENGRPVKLLPGGSQPQIVLTDFVFLG